MRQNEKDDLEFIVSLCCDVLVEALFSGDRCQLTKLERVGRRFHRIIENFFNQRPFLLFGLEVDQRFIRKIYSWKRIKSKRNLLLFSGMEPSSLVTVVVVGVGR